MKKYINVHIELNEENFDLFYAYIQDFKFTGIEEKSDEIIVSFILEDWNEQTKNEFITLLQKLNNKSKIIKEEIIEDMNWNEEWEKNVPAIIVNDRIGIAPLWKLYELTQEIKIVINPKMSFGTGEHATTRLVCQLMEKHVMEGSFWIDAGTGTGVLAILSVKLGAYKVFCFDNDDWSIENAKENFQLNNVQDKIEIIKSDINSIQLPECNGITANLFLHLINSSLPKFYDSLKASKGDLIISGILKYDIDEVINKALSKGFILIDKIFEDEWVGIHFKAG